jgi:hypothetical protein
MQTTHGVEIAHFVTCIQLHVSIDWGLDVVASRTTHICARHQRHACNLSVCTDASHNEAPFLS